MPASARLTVLAVVAWLLCFAVLARWGTWAPFAVVGAALAVMAFRYQALPLALLRPSPGRVGAGVLAGALMVALTHVAYASVVSVVPSVLPATRVLFRLLNVAGFSATERAALIVLIASCEEVLFRGPLLCPETPSKTLPTLRPMRPEVIRVFTFAAAYALGTASLGSPLLMLCAFTCGSLWGWLSIVAGSLTVPILAHVTWDLGVLLVWPLSTRF